MDTLADHAVHYARLGYRVFPIRRGSKKPISPNGFKDAVTDEGLIRAWWDEHPTAAIGTPDTCTIDIEAPKPPKNGEGEIGPDGFVAWTQLTAQHGSPVAPETTTGLYLGRRGRQVHFRARDDVAPGCFAAGVEVRAHGAYVLLPPSPHPTGVSYEGELPPIDQLPPLPEWVAELRRAYSNTARQERKARGEGRAADKIRHPERHQAWVSEAGTLRRQGVPLAEARRQLLEYRDRWFENAHEKTEAELDEILDYYDDWDGDTPRELPQDIVRLSSVGLKEVEYIEYPLLQASAFTLMAGRPGVGKGAICARWVARCSSGDMYGKPRNVLWLSSEDDPEIDLGPRVEAAGGDRDRVYLLPHTFRLPNDIDWLRDTTEKVGEVGLVIIDPIGNHTGAANTDRESEVRTALMPLAVFANEIDIATVGIRHFSTKELSGGAIAKILGSTAWIGVPRVVLGVGPKSVVPSGPPWRLGVSKPPSPRRTPDEVAR